MRQLCACPWLYVPVGVCVAFVFTCLSLAVLCIRLLMAVLLFLWLPWSVFVCRCLSLSVILFADNFTPPPLSHSPVSPLPLSRAGTPQPSRACCSRAHLCVCACVCVCVCVRACARSVRACASARVRACVRACVRALRALRCVWPVGAGRGYATNIFQHLAACTALKPHTRMSMHPLVKFRQRIGRPEESWCPWQTEGRPACFCGSRCRSFAAGTCVHASQPQKAPPQDRRIARVRGSEFRTGRKGADACPRTLCMGGNLRSISASSTSGGVPSCGVRGISFVRHDHSGAGPTMIAGCS